MNKHDDLDAELKETERLRKMSADDSRIWRDRAFFYEAELREVLKSLGKDTDSEIRHSIYKVLAKFGLEDLP